MWELSGTTEYEKNMTSATGAPVSSIFTNMVDSLFAFPN